MSEKKLQYAEELQGNLIGLGPLVCALTAGTYHEGPFTKTFIEPKIKSLLQVRSLSNLILSQELDSLVKF